MGKGKGSELVPAGREWEWEWEWDAVLGLEPVSGTARRAFARGRRAMPFSQARDAARRRLDPVAAGDAGKDAAQVMDRAAAEAGPGSERWSRPAMRAQVSGERWALAHRFSATFTCQQKQGNRWANAHRSPK
jgi:hypothetical protein